MAKKLGALGTLRFAGLPAHEPRPNPLARGHASHLCHPWCSLLSGWRALPAGLSLHGSLLERLGQVVHDGTSDEPLPYRPENLLGEYFHADLAVRLSNRCNNVTDGASQHDAGDAAQTAAPPPGVSARTSPP
jgi:hypothetical protein